MKVKLRNREEYKNYLSLDKEEIKRLYLKENKSSKEIAEIFGCCDETITKRLKSIGVNLKGGKKQLDNEEIKRLYLTENKSCCKIAKIFNVCPSTIIRILNNMGIKTPLNRIGINKDKIKELYLSGESSISISKILNCSHCTILNVLKNMNVKRRNNKEKTLNYFKRHINPRKISLDKFKEELVEDYKRGHSTSQISKKFNISSNLMARILKGWGVKIRHEIFGSRKKSFQSISKDGHIVKSSSELEIDDWLFNNRIQHIYEKKIGFGNFKCDFYIPDANLYIEYFGLISVKSYREKTVRKLKAYKQLGLNLLPIFPKDNIQQKLSFLLQYSQNQTKLTDFIKT